MSAPPSSEQIEAIKNRMREDPEIQRLAKTLGVTLERFLADIEQQGESVALHDATTPEEKSRAEDEIHAAAEKGYGAALQRQATLQGRHDRAASADSARREAEALARAGGVAKKAAPEKPGTGAVVAPEDPRGQQIKAQVTAARLAPRRA